jgi:hypothetical protein
MSSQYNAIVNLVWGWDGVVKVTECSVNESRVKTVSGDSVKRKHMTYLSTSSYLTRSSFVPQFPCIQFPLFLKG